MMIKYEDCKSEIDVDHLLAFLAFNVPETEWTDYIKKYLKDVKTKLNEEIAKLKKSDI